MEDIFNSSAFKFLFNLDPKRKVRYSSISERLSVINIDFFKKSYELIYNQFSQYYSEDEIEGLKLIRVDSTLVAEAANKLLKGMNIGKKKDGKKQIKYTIAYDGQYPCMSELFTEKRYLSEDLAIPQVVYKYAEKNTNSVFVFDRGVAKREVFCNLDKQDTYFITRLKDNFRHRIIFEIEDGKNRSVGSLELKSDQIIQLGKPNSKAFLENYFRLIIAINPKTKITYFFLTNIFDSKVEEILSQFEHILFASLLPGCNPCLRFGTDCKSAPAMFQVNGSSFKVYSSTKLKFQIPSTKYPVPSTQLPAPIF